MKFIFSNRISPLKPSAIREIFKVLEDPTVISFAGGNPSAETFPAEDMAEIAADIFRDSAGVALQYGITEGYTPLRELITARLRDKYGIDSSFDDTVVVTGGQQGIELTTKALVNEGEVIICEEPSFIGALNAFRSYGAKLVGVPLENDGMNMEALEKALKDNPTARFIYVIPTFQNPSGVTTSLEKRKTLLELSKRYGVPILEDNPYFELRYSGEPVPTIKSMDDEGNVIYVGSFSKVISPGIRVGFVRAHKDIISKIVVAKQISDVHTNQFFMMLVARFLQKPGLLDLHIERARKLYIEKRDLLLSLLDEKLKGLPCTYTRPDGGLFIWLSLPEGYNGAELCRLMGSRKVAAVPGSVFMCDDTLPSPALRLNYSMPTLEQIDTGIKIFAGCVEEYLNGGAK